MNPECRCGECREKHRKMCPFACPHCYRDLLDGMCHYAGEHPNGLVFVVPGGGSYRDVAEAGCH